MNQLSYMYLGQDFPRNLGLAAIQGSAFFLDQSWSSKSWQLLHQSLQTWHSSLMTRTTTMEIHGLLPTLWLVRGRNALMFGKAFGIREGCWNGQRWNLLGLVPCQLWVNRQAVHDALEVWGSHHTSEAKSPPVNWLKEEAGMWQDYLGIPRIYFSQRRNKIDRYISFWLGRCDSSMSCWTLSRSRAAST